MVFVFSKEGQLANRLWQAAHFVANAIEYNHRLLHFGFSDYYEHFSESLNNINSSFQYRLVAGYEMSFLEKILFQYCHLSRKMKWRFKSHLPFIKELAFFEFSSQKYDLSQPSFLHSCKRNIMLLDGWFFKDKDALVKHADVIRKTFVPNWNYRQNIVQLKEEQFANFDVVIGVHIRRGDYKTYRNGIWFYSDEEYVCIMEKVLLLDVFKSKKTAFFICSDEKIDYTSFTKFNLIESTNHLIEDLYALSLCSYIVGPPSTYSAWASFYGQVPIFHFENKTISNICFKVVDFDYC